MSPPLPTESERNAQSRSGLQVWHQPISRFDRLAVETVRYCRYTASSRNRKSDATPADRIAGLS